MSPRVRALVVGGAVLGLGALVGGAWWAGSPDPDRSAPPAAIPAPAPAPAPRPVTVQTGPADRSAPARPAAASPAPAPVTAPGAPVAATPRDPATAAALAEFEETWGLDEDRADKLEALYASTEAWLDGVEARVAAGELDAAGAERARAAVWSATRARLEDLLTEEEEAALLEQVGPPAPASSAPAPDAP